MNDWILTYNDSNIEGDQLGLYLWPQKIKDNNEGDLNFYQFIYIIYNIKFRVDSFKEVQFSTRIQTEKAGLY